MAVLLAAMSALVYGCADFLGGKGTRRASTWSVTASSQLVGFATVIVCLPFVSSSGPTMRDIGLGAIGGIGGGVGVMLLYHALAHGTMSIVSPVTAVLAATVPVVFGLVVFGQRPGLAAIVGIVCAIAAVALVSISRDGRRDAHVMRTVVWSIGAGLGFGVFFVFLDRTGDHAGLWPLVGARPVSIALASVVALRQGDKILVTRKAWPMVAAAGAGDMLANMLFLFASSRGQLAITGVLASMYPVSTVALARVVDHERLRPIQLVGLLVALLALVLIAL